MDSIWQIPEVRGNTAPDPDCQVAKCSLYMNDVSIFWAGQHSVMALVITWEEFGLASGAKISWGYVLCGVGHDFLRPLLLFYSSGLHQDLIQEGRSTSKVLARSLGQSYPNYRTMEPQKAHHCKKDCIMRLCMCFTTQCKPGHPMSPFTRSLPGLPFPLKLQKRWSETDNYV